MTTLDLADAEAALAHPDCTDEQAAEILAALELDRLESDYEAWLAELFPSHVTEPLAEHHHDFWRWCWSLEVGTKPRPFLGVWSRGGAKSTSAEMAVVAIAARRLRRYALWVCDTQDQADDHVGNVAAMLESAAIARWYPGLSSRALNKYGNSKGWRHNRLRTASGFTIDALGLDSAARGAKIDEDRPGLVVFDDVDAEDDGPAQTERKIADITRKLLPAGGADLAVVGIQNLVIPDGVFAQLADGRADFLQHRIVSGPVPAVRDLVTTERADETGGLRTVIIGGEATWTGQSLEVCQSQIDEWGITAFKSEAQHDLSAPPGGMFDHVTFQRATRAEYDRRVEIRAIVDVAVWVDPAVTNKDTSDCQACQLDARDNNGALWRLRSWEQRSSPLEAIKLAIRWAIDEGASVVGIETDQGRDTWQSVYKQACDELRDEQLITDDTVVPRLTEAQAGATQMSKAARVSQMLADYERANSQIIHVEGTHHLLEAALRRFPKTKPFDLADASYWGWRHFRARRRARLVA